jgi:hypothetical protein
VTDLSASGAVVFVFGNCWLTTQPVGATRPLFRASGVGGTLRLPHRTRHRALNPDLLPVGELEWGTRGRRRRIIGDQSRRDVGGGERHGF